MVRNVGQAGGSAFLQGALLIFLLLAIPLVLSNHPEGAFFGILLLQLYLFSPVTCC